MTAPMAIQVIYTVIRTLQRVVFSGLALALGRRCRISYWYGMAQTIDVGLGAATIPRIDSKPGPLFYSRLSADV
jgi:hypothetical protein